jgi:hypothetical protein
MMTAAESHCRCGYETGMEFCPKCGSPDRFTTAQVQERRSPRWFYLVAGLLLQAVPLGAAVWILS